MNLGNVVGQTLDDKYKIEKELGRGGMGTVYLATHVGTARPVAVKVIAPEFMERAEFVERFRREARAAGRLRHPNVVNVTDFGFSETNDGEVAYLVMEYLDGCTLGEILEEEKQLPLSWSIDILEQVCSAVHEAHEQGIIHRDLKPDNIWLEPNQRGGYTVKVLDFGIAKLEETQTISPNENFSVPTTPTQIGNKNTFADENQLPTIADQTNSTVISEANTLAQTANDRTISNKKTLLSEAGTLIQTANEVDLESGTAILPIAENPSTENIGTKLISAQMETDESALKNVSTAELTHVGAVLGTPLYMSPEQCRGEKLSAQSDIYSLGIIAYQMLSGKTPFAGDFEDVMDSHKDVEPPPLEVRKTPKKLKKMIMSALSKDVAERPPTAEAFASKLRANAEGLGELCRRSLVIYSEHLPQFLLVAFMTAIPFLLLTILKVSFKFLELSEVVKDGIFSSIFGSFLGIAAFFVQIFCAAFLVGVTTWIVAQILAFPLRPISLRAAFKEAEKHWKPFAGTVTLSTLLALLSWGIGFIVGGLISLVVSLPLYFFVSQALAIAVGAIIAILGAVCFGLYASAIFMLIAPSIMMEHFSGRVAFRRSVELAKRSFWTVFSTSLLVYVVPGVLAFTIAIATAAIVKSVSNELKDNKETSEVKPENEDLSVKVGAGGIKITNDGEKNASDEQAEKTQKIMKSINSEISSQIFELIWLPIIILISSFTSVITALLYFKTRQAGGESMSDLLEQFEDAERPRSNWQKRIRQRLEQSGKLTSKS